MIGNTPLIKIIYKYNNKINEVYIKMEAFNLTGSVKDRMVKYILDKAKEGDKLLANMPIVEATSGNTGISLAAFGALYKHPVHIYLPDWVSEERISLLKMFGAKVYLVSKSAGGFEKAIELADQLALEINGYRLNQFDNLENINAHYYGLGTEIEKEISNIGAFVSGVGTGGTLMGVGLKLQENNKDTKIVCLEPKDYAVISNKEVNGSHQIEGIGDDFIPSILDIDIIDQIVLIDDNDAINMARLLSKELGLGVGISSGANFLASVITKDKLNDNVVTLFPDDNKKYISTSLSDDIDLNNDFLSNKIELLNYEMIKK